MKRAAGMTTAPEAWVDLYWLPLGAGGHSVRWNGRVFEAVAARLGRRPPCDLYHSALEVRVPDGRFVIEQTPVPSGAAVERGVVASGAVGARRAGRFRIFRYEVRRWRDGVIPDVAEAVQSPQRLTDDPCVSQRVHDAVPDVPTAVWGRDELGAGEMWNSNSIISWLIARGGIDAEAVQCPTGGRAPGWRAGLVVARRQEPMRVGAESNRRRGRRARLGSGLVGRLLGRLARLS
jgi:hypothetical protein